MAGDAAEGEEKLRADLGVALVLHGGGDDLVIRQFLDERPGFAGRLLVEAERLRGLLRGGGDGWARVGGQRAHLEGKLLELQARDGLEQRRGGLRFRPGLFEGA